MKLLHLVSGADAGGAMTHVLSLLPELQKTDTVCLACLGGGPLALGAAERGIKTLVLPGGAISQLSGLNRRLIEQRPDVLHCHGARANVLGALARRGPGTRVVSTVHSDHRLDYLSRPMAAQTLGRLNGWALGRMDALFCVSDAMAERYRRRGFRCVYALYNGLDFSAPPLAPISRGDTVPVGIAARLDPVKDLETALRGFAMASKREPRLRLRIAGTGREENRLRALAGRLGVSGTVEFCGWVEDMDRFFAALDIAALTSLSETFPYALLLAARQAIPAVATDVGGVSALVKHGEGGLLITPGDASAFAQALLRLAGNESERLAMGRALRLRAQTHFPLERTAETVWELYRRVWKDNQTKERR